MYTISQIGGLFSISRSTLLYYDSVGLLSAARRSPSGYRLYSEEDRDRLEKIRQLRDLGVPIPRIRRYLACGNDDATAILLQRILAINEQIGVLRDQQDAILAMVEAEGSLNGVMKAPRARQGLAEKIGVSRLNYRQVHRVFEKASPVSHRRLLGILGFSPAQVRDLLKEVKKKD
jgi:DNA-binding transcriptional MerR regulator